MAAAGAHPAGDRPGRPHVQPRPVRRRPLHQAQQLTAEIAGALSDGEPAPLRLAVEQAEGYLTPKLDVRAAVFDERRRVLLVQEHSDGRWSLPGGWADVGEGPAEGAVREVREETGYVVEYERLLGVYDRERWGHPPVRLVHPQGGRRVPAPRRRTHHQHGDGRRRMVRPRRRTRVVDRPHLPPPARPGLRAPRRPGRCPPDID